MSALLGNPMIATAALPFVLGIVLGLLSQLADLRSSLIAVLLWGAALLFLYWETLGGPVFPPLAASQKLIYLGMLGIALGLLAAVLFGGRSFALLVATALLAGFVWLGWRRLTGGELDLVVAVAIVATLLAALGAFSLVSLRIDPGADAQLPFVAPAAILALALAGALISVLGASIVVGQFLGSIAALVGGYCLVGYVVVLTGRAATIGWGRGVEAVLLLTACSALLQTALLAPKANPVALLLAPLPLFMPRLLAGPLKSLLPGARPLRPLVTGLLIAVPAILAVLIAVVWAPEGAALGLS